MEGGSRPGPAVPNARGFPNSRHRHGCASKLGWVLEMLPQKESLNEALAQVHEAQRDALIMHICILSNPHKLYNANLKKKKPTNRKVKIFLGSKTTMDGDCSYEIKRHLLLGRKAMTNLDAILKSREHFANKGPHSQSYGFPVILYEFESWTIEKAER